MFEKLMNRFACVEEVDYVCLGGSRGRKTHDLDSDYDVYVYLNSELELEKRRVLIDDYVSYMEYGNHFWELEDDGVLKNGIEIEFIYRDSDFLSDLEQNTRNQNMGIGYSTCMLDNVLNSKLLIDNKGDFEEKRNTLKSLITDELFETIINNDKPLLKDSIPALTNQIKKAVKRQDLHSINHRITEFFSIYYDILFARNKELHKGEKRLFETALTFDVLPADFEEDIPYILKNMYTDLNAGEKVEEISIKLLNIL